MNLLKTPVLAKTLLFIGTSLATIAIVSMSLPSSANAAVYAYVDATGEVKSVTANDWMTAIAIAPNIHIHSGVLLLTTAYDYTIVGDNVAAF